MVETVEVEVFKIGHKKNKNDNFAYKGQTRNNNMMVIN